MPPVRMRLNPTELLFFPTVRLEGSPSATKPTAGPEVAYQRVTRPCVPSTLEDVPRQGRSAVSDRTIDHVNRDLSEVLDGLLALPSDAFADRYVLQERQRALRDEAAAFAEDHDAKRPTAELLKELAALRTNLEALWENGSTWLFMQAKAEVAEDREAATGFATASSSTPPWTRPRARTE